MRGRVAKRSNLNLNALTFPGIFMPRYELKNINQPFFFDI
jgi:hypothetical protein